VEGHASRHDEARGFKHMGEFATAVQRAQTPGNVSVDERLLDLSAAATGMSQGSGPDGGYMVPPSFSTEIWDGLNKTPDNLLAETDNYTVEGESLTFAANAETSRATGSRYGGIRGYWLAEAAQMTGSAPKVRQLKLEPHGMAVLVYVTDKLLKNAAALAQYLNRAATDEINFLTNDAIIEGTGAGKPLGILKSKCVVEVPKEVGQGAATIVSENIMKMFSRLHARSRQTAKWYINQDCEPQLSLMTIGVGAAGQPVYMPPGGLSQSPYATLMGRPVVPIEYCSTVGTVGDIILADLSAYATGTVGGVEEAMSMHLRFDFNETAFRFLFQVDGQPWLASPITPFKGANTTSPFVTLATRA
jgi:HK97 family phage major capsid protein